MLATGACLEELPAEKKLGVRIGGCNPEDPTGDTTKLAEFTAWVGGMWHTSASVNPSNGDPLKSDILRS